ncbi:Uncharacterized protein conserved in bacteria [Serratia entomophila]|uniref:acyltransferase family protein n=1 Tax=Serratia entomophila TaxID=42906 RepID=UPI001F3F8AF0|nr:acyltransferase [Serratia entomophila]UIW16568.1 acyltransferase [Serratia entomophila]CAI0692701.1 Uncharacterized protein conserved in bacteria [Serratia entomophila]CAI0693417.1 Uncharacterized protein conserved in bacteria [Serratia entomophila]CAI0693454.1 Uncharacterized protein conserved in bacteria [Serratia entomophila]CAI0733595.1 Uncharacterized protein conserved in bacteria [Serratia entomophila]
MSTSLTFGFVFLLAIILSYLTVSICKFTPLNIRLPEGRRSGYIDGLRGYLALMVAAHHYFIFYGWLQNGDWLPPEINYINNFGKVAVCLFFMITGYLFIGKIYKDKSVSNKISWVKIYTSRVFRIFPLYLLAVAVTVLYTFIVHDYKLNVSLAELAKEVVKWLLYLGDSVNGDPDAKRVTAGVTWTLKYEWIFYLSLPLLAAFFSNKMTTVLITVLSIIIYFSGLHFGSIDFKYIIFFVLGGFTFAIEQRYSDALRASMASAWVSVIGLVAIVLVIFFTKDPLGPLGALCMLVFFVPVVMGNSIFGVLSGSGAIKLGEISFSLYLLHGIVFYTALVFFIDKSMIGGMNSYLMFMPLGMIALVIISLMTYKGIEKPFIDFGRQLANGKVFRSGVSKAR